MGENKQGKFRWWYILICVAAVALVAGVMWGRDGKEPARDSADTKRQDAPDESGEMRDYATLPEILTMEDGTGVKDEKQFEERRQEILRLFEENVYGSLPKDGFETSFEVVEEGEALDGAAVRKQIKITVATEKGTSDALMLLYLPKSGQPAPVVIGLNGKGNPSVYNDPEILKSYSDENGQDAAEESRGSEADSWCVEMLIERGYGLATICCGDFAADNAETYGTRVISLFDDSDFRTVSAWAFGISRGIDYLETERMADAGKIADIGHSRLGKAAVWAGANDERIALVISNESGNSGASLSRASQGETVEVITQIFAHWFCDKYVSYAGKENELPVDQHELLACIAPRKVYVATAKDDGWGDPAGAWNALLCSREAFELYGFKTIDGDVLKDVNAQPEMDTGVFAESMGYHMRSGKHDMLPEDWEYYLDYMDEYIK